MPSSGGGSERYRVRDLVVDVTGASVWRGGERIALPPRTFELLVALVRRYPSTVRRHDLLDAVWPDEHVTDQTLSHRVMVLRKAIADHAEVPAYVAGERGFGYRLVAPVERLPPHQAEASAAGGERPKGRRAGSLAVLLVALAVALVLVARAEWKAPTPPRGGEDQARRSAHVERLCLSGEFFFLSFTREGLRRSAGAWEQAIALDPACARAHAGRSLTGGVRALLELVTVAEAERLARDGAERALELEPGSPTAQLAASLVRLLFDWDAPGAASAARRASRRDPEDLRGAIVLSLALLAEGRLEEGERVLESAALADANAAAVAYLEGLAHAMRGRWKDASAAYARALALEPELAAARRGEALIALLVPERGGGGAGARLQLCRDERASLDAARACLLEGARERAERVLAAAVAARAPAVVLAPHDALLQPLRGEPAMRELAARMRPPSRAAR